MSEPAREPSGQPDRHHDDPRQGFIDVVGRLSKDAGPDGMTIREVLDHLDERSFGLLIAILAIPCLVPGLYGVPQVVGLVILLLAAQILVGRVEPWLPDVMLDRRISKGWLETMATFADKRMRWTERVSRPRLTLLATGLGERIAAAFMIVATLTIVIPFTNTVPSVALTLLAVGLIQRDGLFVGAGAALTTAWAGFLLAIPIGLYLGAGWAQNLWSRFN